MGEIQSHPPVLLLLAAFSRHAAALEWARQRASETFGPAALESEAFPFEATTYYEQTMGAGLRKSFLAFERLIDPADLVEIKHQTNAWEEECARQCEWPEPRPLNLDPGYLTEAKLVLASTKDHQHRLYLDRGIYAEETLFYLRGAGWQAREWTFPDYRRDDYHQFFLRCRDYLRGRYGKRGPKPGEAPPHS
jgi:hypothetical protein